MGNSEADAPSEQPLRRDPKMENQDASVGGTVEGLVQLF